jgi:hypothetical protein
MSREGSIYKIVSKQTNKCYIGSTIHPLAVRLYNHFKSKSNITSKQILKYNDATIELIETVKFDDVKELRLKEYEHIQRNKECCVNERHIYKDVKEWRAEYKEKNKEKNKEKLKKIHTEYRIKNREKIREWQRQRTKRHREANPLPPRKTEEEKKEKKKQYMLDHIKEKKEYDAEYRELNNEKINKQYECECGGLYKLRHKSAHLKTTKHLAYKPPVVEEKTVEKESVE